MSLITIGNMTINLEQIVMVKWNHVDKMATVYMTRNPILEFTDENYSKLVEATIDVNYESYSNHDDHFPWGE